MVDTSDWIEENKLHQKETGVSGSHYLWGTFPRVFQNEEREVQGSKSTLQRKNLGGSSSQSEKMATPEVAKPIVHDIKSHPEQHGKR